MKFGRIFIWGVLIFLVSYLLFFGQGGQPIQFISDILVTLGTTRDSAFQASIVLGFLLTVVMDAIILGDD